MERPLKTLVNQFKQEIVKASRTRMKKFDAQNIYYVYALMDPRKPGPWKVYYDDILILSLPYLPFYIGKGKGRRMHVHLEMASETEINNHKLNKIRKILEAGLEPVVRKVSTLSDEVTAFAKEKLLIKAVGRSDRKEGPLTNHTCGGEGFVGGTHTKITRKKMSESQRTRWDNTTQQEKDHSGNLKKEWWYCLSDVERDKWIRKHEGWFQRKPIEWQVKTRSTLSENAKVQHQRLTLKTRKEHSAYMLSFLSEEQLRDNGKRLAAHKKAHLDALTDKQREDYHRRRGEKISESHMSRSKIERKRHRQLISEAKRAKPDLVCPHCGHTGRYLKPMQARHFDNCSSRVRY